MSLGFGSDTLAFMRHASSENERPASKRAERASKSELEARTEPKLRAIVQALARHAASRAGGTRKLAVLDSYSDRSISGASLIRPGIQALMRDA